MAKQGYFNKSYNLFKNSFRKLNKKTVFIILSDIVFFAIMLSIMVYFPAALYNKVASFDETRLSNANLMDVSKAKQLNDDLRGILFAVIGYPLLMVLLTMINTALFQGISWSIALKRKLNIKFFMKFFLLNFVVIGLYTAVVFCLALVMKQEALAFWTTGLIAVWLHFTLLMYVYFIKGPAKGSVKKAFVTGVKKLYLFIFPYAVLIIILAVLGYIMYIITKVIPAQGVGVSIMALVMLAYVAWARYYYIDVVDSL